MRLGGEDQAETSRTAPDKAAAAGSASGGGGNMLGCLLPMVTSRFGVVGVVILLLGYCALTQFGGGSGGLLPSGPSTSTAPARPIARSIPT